MRLWSPSGDLRLCDLYGKTLIVPADPAGVDVPDEAVGPAVIAGCLPVGARFVVAQELGVAHAAMAPGATERPRSAAPPLDGLRYSPVAPNAVGRDLKPSAGSPTPRAGSAHRTVRVALDNPLVTKLDTELQTAGPLGLTRTQIQKSLGRNVPGRRIAAALELLRVNGRANSEKVQTRGHPAERWRSTSLPSPCASPSVTTETTKVAADG